MNIESIEKTLTGRVKAFINGMLTLGIYVIFLAVVAGLLMFVLPETHRKVLPTTLDEGEKFGVAVEDAHNDDETKNLKISES